VVDNVTTGGVTRPNRAAVWLIVVLALGAAGAAFAYLGGAAWVVDLLAGGTGQQAKTSGQGPAGQSQSPAAGGGNSDASQLVLPPGVTEADAMKMYSEQIESNEQIRDLASGRMRVLDLSDASEVDADASVKATATYDDGHTLVGTLDFKKFSAGWYFTSIKRNGVDYDQDFTAGAGRVDRGVLNAILREQSRNQDVVTEIVSGEYERFDVKSVRKGSGTSTVIGEMIDAQGVATKVEVIAIKKRIGGVDYWFLTGFRKV